MFLSVSTKKRHSGSVQIQGCGYNDNDRNCFKGISGLNPIKLPDNKFSQVLITLTVPDTWCDQAGDGAWFAIKVNNEIVARGLYTCGMNGQRVPITLQAAVDLTDNEDYQIEGMWCNTNGTNKRPCYIGDFSETVLSVIGFVPMPEIPNFFNQILSNKA